MRAVLEHDLSYAELRQISRNGLAYSFLDTATKKQLLAEWDAAWAKFESATLTAPGTSPAPRSPTRPH